MLNTKLTIYLASQSPRRKKLLKQLGIKFKSLTLNFHEEIADGEHPIKTVKRLALHKSDYASKKIKNGIIITADTIVVLKKEIIGKPKSKKDAFDILSKLSNRRHTVYTGFVIRNLNNKKTIVDYEKTNVTFRLLTVNEYSEDLDLFNDEKLQFGLGERIRLFAKRKFGTLKKLADAMSISPQQLQQYISGKREPGSKVLIRLLKLGCDINWLLGGRESLESYKIFRLENELRKLQSSFQQITEVVQKTEKGN